MNDKVEMLEAEVKRLSSEIEKLENLCIGLSMGAVQIGCSGKATHSNKFIESFIQSLWSEQVGADPYYQRVAHKIRGYAIEQ